MSAAALNSRPARATWSRTTWALILMGALALGFGIWAAFNWFEVVDEEEWVGARGEAVTNSLLLLERLLVAQGASVARVKGAGGVSGLDQPLGLSQTKQTKGTEPAKPTVMMIASGRLAQMTPERIAALRAWVRAGGELVVEAEHITLEDPLLEQWGIDRVRLIRRGEKFVEVNRRLPPGRWPVEPNDKRKKDADDADPVFQTEVEDPEGGRPRQRGMLPKFKFPPEYRSTVVELADGMSFEARFYPTQNLVLNPALPAALPKALGTAVVPLIAHDAIGGRIAELNDGKGRVTVLTSFRQFRWTNLKEADHAELAWHLVSRGVPEGTHPAVTVVTLPASEGFGDWVMTHAWTVLLTLMLALLMWLWHVLPRVGPLLPPVSNVRRSLLEHLAASGKWFAVTREWQALVEPVRRRFLARVVRRHPRVAAMSANARVDWLARRLNVPHDVVARALQIPVDNRADCVNAIRHITRWSYAIERAPIS